MEVAHVARAAPSQFCYSIGFGPFTGDGLPMLGLAESKPNFSFKANDRNSISRSDTHRHFPSKSGSSRAEEDDGTEDAGFHEQQPIDRFSGTSNSSGLFSLSNSNFEGIEAPTGVPVPTRVLGGFAIHTPSEQLVAIQPLDLISDSDIEDIWRPTSVDRTRSLFLSHYQTFFGPLTSKGDGLPVLGQGKPKNVTTPTLMERDLPVCSNKLHFLPFIKSGVRSLPQHNGGYVPGFGAPDHKGRLQYQYGK
ncbi:hypothetical protein E3N88_40101 [Mikania micrantha]|uniref:Uncharacterized protein n=1 Tax=Mikania micrantha TaxID=192012 RepID=A0A5N6LLT3_9ASTR|nr:hypothetical protein E3N88_40101 [Mikania micrantha]